MPIAVGSASGSVNSSRRSPIAASRYQWLANPSLRDRKQSPTRLGEQGVYFD